MTLTCVGRSFYTPEMPSPISGGAEVWLGYYQSLRATQAGLTLNVDMSAMAFVRSMPMVRKHIKYYTFSGGFFSSNRLCVICQNDYFPCFVSSATL